MSDDKVVPLPFRRAVAGELAQKIQELIYTYAGRISVTEAVGILEIVKFALLTEEHS